MGTSFPLNDLWAEFRPDWCTNSSLLPESYCLNPWASQSGPARCEWSKRTLSLKSEQAALWHEGSGARNAGSGRTQRGFWPPRGEWRACEKPFFWLITSGEPPKSGEIPKWEQCSAWRQVVSVVSATGVICVTRWSWAFFLRVFWFSKGSYRQAFGLRSPIHPLI